ncbi:MAG: nuclear transport factor 2 family protein, partial [Robiginitalea sp.]|nr:nuclear transport factor 2 family protein [Robiginitalea sp.]
MKQDNPHIAQEIRAIYQRMVGVMLDFDNAEDLEKTIHPDFIGYGTAEHEFLKTREDVKKMARMQKEQLEGQEFRYERKLIAEKIFANGTSCLIVEEFNLFFPGNDHHLLLRLSSLLERIDGAWLVTHVHGSTPDSNIAEDEAFPEQGLRKKNEALEAKIRQRTRELEIEAALERVRSRTMGMQQSDELPEVIAVLFEQLVTVGIDSWMCVLALKNSQTGGLDLLMSTQLANIMPKRYRVPPLDHRIFHEFMSGWDEGLTFKVIEYEGAEKREYDELLLSQEDFANESSNLKEITRASDRVCASVYYMKYGMIQAIGDRRLPEEKNKILIRFARAFEQTYTRFIDLKKAEAQAREGEIEIALERVRSRSMAMQNSEELKSVIRVIFDQLAGLKINAEHAGIVVDYSPGRDWNFWIAETQEIPSKITIPYLGSLWDRQYTEAKEKGVDFFTTELNFEQKNTFYEGLLEHIPGLTEETREFYLTCPGLAISTVVKEDVGLYIENFSGVPYSEEENSVLKRFGTVFQQTYTRFLDLKKAEAQARESQIELGLERVRARAMAMQASEELSDLVITVFRELSNLDMVLTRCLIWIFDPQDDSSMAWMANSEDPDVADSYFVPYHDHPAYHSYLNGWKSRHPKWEYSLEGEVKESWDEILVYGYFESLPENIKEAMRAPERVMLSGSFNNFGVIQTASLEPLSQENLDILYRFSHVFEQSYTRFLDLKKAEAQAREAQVEAALERIRAQVTGMQESVELLDIVVTMRSEFLRLGHEAHYFWHMRWLPNTYQKAMTSGDGTRIGMVMELPRHIHGDIPLLAAWEEGEEPTVVYAMDAEAAVDYVDKMVSLGNFQQIDPQAPSAEDIRHIGGLTFVMARTTHGEIGFSLPGVVPDPPAEALETLVRFAGVFDLAYRRFEDLKESEQQKREAEIELALERVRARTMAMQKSEELADVAFLLFQQLRSLGGKLWGTGFGLCEEDSDSDTFWFAYEKGVLPPGSIPNTTDPAHKKMYEGWKDGREYLAIEASGEALENHYEYMMSLEVVRPFFQEILDKGLTFPQWQQWNAAYFRQGYLLIISLEPYPEPEVLKRFARVFDQTYTRFLDLKKAEAQARESEIQLALERVRAATMAMHHSGELSDVLSTLFEQYDVLGINPSHAVLTLIDKEKNTLNFRTTGTKGYRVEAEQEVDLNIVDAWLDTTEKWKKSNPNDVNVNEYPPEVLPEVWEVYGEILDEIPKNSRPRIEDFPNGLFITEGYCRFGYIGFAHHREPTEEEKEIVKRFAGEFGTLYQRFLDLKKAEAQAREARIEAALERVRAQTMAMHQSEDLEKSAEIVFEELEKLDLSIERSGIGIFDRESRNCRLWTTVVSEEGIKELATGITSLTIHPMLTKTFEAWENQEPLSYVLEGKELQEYYEIVSKSEFILSEQVLEKSASLPREYYHYTPFGAGGLYFFSDSEPTISDTRVMRRFAEVFDMT